MQNDGVMPSVPQNVIFWSPSCDRHSQNGFHGNIYNNQNNNSSNMPVHLISSDLWEAITGEHVTPIKICQILSYLNPGNDAGPYNGNGGGNRGVGQLSHSMQLVTMAKDRVGSRSLQQRIEDSGNDEKILIFNALYPSLKELVADQAANFVVQKLCDIKDDDLQNRLLQFFLANIEKVVEQPNSCRVLQKFIECTSIANVEQVFLAVKSNLLNLCLSQNGNHIVQRFIEKLPQHTNDIIDCVIPHLVHLAEDNCGCRVVQRLFEKYDVDTLAPLVDEVLKYSAELATNQYGNYVVQNILEAKRPEHISKLVKNFNGQFYLFSMHKFASNVVEKVIRSAQAKEQSIIFSEIIGSEGHYNEERIRTMIIDQFGNYVMQRIIEYGTESQQNAIYEVVYNHFDSINSINYAKHVISKLEDIGYEF